MPLLDAGRDHVTADLLGESVTPFNNANAHLAIGDGTAVFNKTHTDLQGTNKHREPMDASSPSRVGNVITIVATAEAADANFSWQEFGFANAVSGGTMFNRFLSNQGTKANPQVWRATVTLTIVNGD